MTIRQRREDDQGDVAVRWSGATELERLLVPLDSLTLDPKNAKYHGPASIAAIRAMLEQFGQQKSIVVDGDAIVVAGNGTVTAAREMGWTHIAAALFAGSPQQRRAYAIADNRTAELSTWDEGGLLAALTEERGERPELFTGLGMDDEYVASLRHAVAESEHASTSATPDREHAGGPVAPVGGTLVPLFFDDEQQYRVWTTFLAALAQHHPEIATPSGRFFAYLSALRAHEDVDAA